MELSSQLPLQVAKTVVVGFGVYSTSQAKKHSSLALLDAEQVEKAQVSLQPLALQPL